MIRSPRRSQQIVYNDDSSLEHFENLLLKLIDGCRRKKNEMYELRWSLTRERAQAKLRKKEFDEKNGILTLSTLTLGIVGAIATGPLSFIFYTSTAVSAALKINNANEYRTSMNDEKNAIKKKTDKHTLMAKEIKRKELDFRKRHGQLVANGFSEDAANVRIFIEMIQGIISRSPNCVDYPEQQASMMQTALDGCKILGAAVAPPLSGMVAKFYKEFTERNFLGDKFKIAKCLPSVMAVIFIITETSNYVQTCFGESETVVLIDQISNTLEQGERSLEFFINSLTDIKEITQIEIHQRYNQPSQLQPDTIMQQKDGILNAVQSQAKNVLQALHNQIGNGAQALRSLTKEAIFYFLLTVSIVICVIGGLVSRIKTLAKMLLYGFTHYPKVMIVFVLFIYFFILYPMYFIRIFEFSIFAFCIFVFCIFVFLYVNRRNN